MGKIYSNNLYKNSTKFLKLINSNRTQYYKYYTNNNNTKLPPLLSLFPSSNNTTKYSTITYRTLLSTSSISAKTETTTSKKEKKENKKYIKDIPLLPIEYLRTICSTNYDKTTYQRNNIKYDILNGCKIIETKKDKNDNYYKYNSVWIEEDEDDNNNKILVIEWYDKT